MSGHVPSDEIIMSDMKTKRAGRPTQDPKGERITLRLSAQDVRALRTEAKKRDTSIGEVARSILRAALRVAP